MNERHCPVCRIPLNPVTIRQTQIDFCLMCRGVWFDKDELSQVQHHGGFPDKFLTASVIPGKRDAIVCETCHTHNDRAARRCKRCGAALSFLCPACRRQLEEVSVGSVKVDRCKTCQGVWFDGGELAILFDEFKQRKKVEIERIRREGGTLDANLASWAAIDALDLLIWRPDLLYHAGHALGHTIADVPGAVAHGVGAAGEFIGDIPDMAGNMAEGAVDLAGGVAAAAGDFIGDMPEIAGNAAEFAGDVIGNVPEMAGNVVEFAGDVIGNVPEMAGALAEAGSSFIEMLFEFIGSLFD